MARDDVYPKVWRCPRCKEALGEVIRDGSGVRKLVIRIEQEGASPSPTKDVMVTIMGDARVRCSCGSERVWVPGEEHLAQILARLQEWHSKR
jgi:hypothetical protein